MIVPYKKRQIIKDKLVADCQECGGNSCNSCTKKSQLIDRMADANIPVAYWFLKLKDFSGPTNVKDAAIAYAKTIKERYQDGKGICFVGTLGVGKTTAGCAILKNAIINDFTAYYTTLSDIMTYMLDFETSSEFNQLVTRVDFLFVDEIDSRHISSSDDAQKAFGSNFERIIRYRTQNQLPTILASNNSSLEEAFSGQHSRVVDSLSAASTIVIPALGKDFRKVQKL
jgi:DNA replication protein DnaC